MAGETSRVSESWANTSTNTGMAFVPPTGRERLRRAFAIGTALNIAYVIARFLSESWRIRSRYWRTRAQLRRCARAASRMVRELFGENTTDYSSKRPWPLVHSGRACKCDPFADCCRRDHVGGNPAFQRSRPG